MIGESEKIVCRIPVHTRVWISVALGGFLILFLLLPEFGNAFHDPWRDRFLVILLTVLSCVWYRYLLRTAMGKTYSLRVDEKGIGTPFTDIPWNEVKSVEVGTMSLLATRDGMEVGKAARFLERKTTVKALRIHLNEGNGAGKRRGMFWRFIVPSREGMVSEFVPAFLLDLPVSRVANAVEQLRERYA